jgi:flagellar biosynthetic protein FliQ
MTEGDVLDLVQAAIWMVIVGSGPVVGAAMVVGVAIALLQALTQVQEMTLTFVPKLLVVFAVFSLSAHFIGSQLQIFTETIYSHIEKGYVEQP